MTLDFCGVWGDWIGCVMVGLESDEGEIIDYPKGS